MFKKPLGKGKYRYYGNMDKNMIALINEQQRGLQTDLGTFNSSSHK